MELDSVKKLLERYFEADTTVAEEELLRDYFSKENIPDDLKPYAPLFGFVAKAKKERFAKPLDLGPEQKLGGSSLYKWLSIAAAAVLMLGVYFGKTYYDEKEVEQQQAQYAYNETKKALDLLAQNMERGTEKMAYLNEFVEAKDKIYNKN